MNLHYKAFLGIQFSEFHKHPALVFCNFVMVEFFTNPSFFKNVVYIIVAGRHIEVCFQRVIANHRAIFFEKVQAAVVYHGSEPRGYMFYQITDDKTFLIQELVALTPDAKCALLRYAGEHCSVADKLYWEAMEDDLTWLDFPDADRAGRVKPFMMARCFDAVQALQRYEVPENCPDGQVTLLL